MVKIKGIRKLLVQLSVLAGLSSLLISIQPLIAQDSAFSYQGFLTDQGKPANATYDFRFALYASATDGSTVAEPVDTGELGVTNGVFIVSLDFGSAVFDGGDRWLEVAVRPGGSSGEFVNVVPRQRIAAAPYAIRAANYSGPVDVSQITGQLAASSIADGTITAGMLSAGAVVASLTADGQGNLVFDRSGLTNLNASALTSGTIPAERFPAILPPIDGSQLTGIRDGNAINSFFGQGTNTDLLNPSYRGILSSTNAYPIVRATITTPPDSAQVWQQLYTGDSAAAPFSFVGTAVTNGFNPAVNNPSPFSGMSDVQLHYGYNMGNAPGYNRDLPTWVRGFESTWFNPYRPPVIEVYDRYVLTNGIVGNAGFGYDLRLEDGYIEATIDAHTLAIRNPTTGFKWMDATSNTNGEGVLTLGNYPYGSGYINFNSTNEWLIVDGGRGIIGSAGNSNYLFTGGTTDDKVTFFKGANSAGTRMSLTLGTTSPRSIRWNGINAPYGWEYETSPGEWRRFNDEVSTYQKSYTIPANTLIGELASDYRTLGTCKADENYTHSVQIDLCFNGGDDQTYQRYIVPISYGAFHADWQELLPLHESGRNNVKHYAVDTRFVTGWREFRVRRIKATGVGIGSFTGVVTAYNGTWTNDVSGFGSGATVSQIETSTPLILTAGKVGINTNNPQAALDVGNAGNVFASGFLVRSNGWAAIPVLQEGDVWLGSSNGILHSISLVGGNYTTNRMVP